MATAANHVIPRFLPLRLPKVCVAVIGRDATEMAQKAETLVRDNPFLEFRLDYLSKPGLAFLRSGNSWSSTPTRCASPRVGERPAGGSFADRLPRKCRSWQRQLTAVVRLLILSCRVRSESSRNSSGGSRRVRR